MYHSFSVSPSVYFCSLLTLFFPRSTSSLCVTLSMWLCVNEAGRLSVTGLHSEEDVGHTHLEGGGREGLSCV